MYEVLDIYNKMDVSNYPVLDMKSIVMYYIPASMNNLEQRIHVNPNTELFDMDKAFVTINYPLDGDMNRMGWSVKDVLDKIAVGEGGKNPSSNVIRVPLYCKNLVVFLARAKAKPSS
ncbi:hypothetical protein DFH94DRAFT_687112 [Russula ochroleuca]|uniref:Uncharacterized protein n=1 Tax=Russula ochroleuca TaxID=152965 RepID=A0A9P5JTP8_9AGAM|nr:hypothetical protein DFH94DRAFT_687112 [Russula ochroleuca]